jgi:hypothetical protein
LATAGRDKTRQFDPFIPRFGFDGDLCKQRRLKTQGFRDAAETQIAARARGEGAMGRRMRQ